jgi:nucleotide-binding universal stress UspA family protein
MIDTPDVNQAFEPEEKKPVLVAIDFSEDSKAALKWAGQYSDRCGIPLVLLHVVHDPVSSPGFYREGNQGQLRPMQEVAESMMTEFVEQLKIEQPDLLSLKTAERHFVPGLPPRRIVEVADLLDASMIVIGSRGLTGLPHMLLGSVAERVVELSHRPVVVVKKKSEAGKNKKELKRIEKKQKKDRKKLKDMLGLVSEAGAQVLVDG